MPDICLRHQSALASVDRCHSLIKEKSPLNTQGRQKLTRYHLDLRARHFIRTHLKTPVTGCLRDCLPIDNPAPRPCSVSCFRAHSHLTGLSDRLGKRTLLFIAFQPYLCHYSPISYPLSTPKFPFSPLPGCRTPLLRRKTTRLSKTGWFWDSIIRTGWA